MCIVSWWTLHTNVVNGSVIHAIDLINGAKDRGHPIKLPDQEEQNYPSFGLYCWLRKINTAKASGRPRHWVVEANPTRFEKCLKTPWTFFKLKIKFTSAPPSWIYIYSAHPRKISWVHHWWERKEKGKKLIAKNLEAYGTSHLEDLWHPSIHTS